MNYNPYLGYAAQALRTAIVELMNYSGVTDDISYNVFKEQLMEVEENFRCISCIPMNEYCGFSPRALSLEKHLPMRD